ncbi:hypothetical protein FDF97_00380 [Clostridium botulinum]|uniref:Uncharacterized protein n=1 Tax=Clostridium botulinum TaxID=1491 RepID=A0A6G4EJR5_CLOBO|nr:hypothetical protein RSJ5_07110 [Clostridium botulinum]MBN3415529.1 hypothetical protein [Clostridium botulinum]MBN3441822.1 hypothetical protein [Clostridium botulinum]NFB14829.1 hypothetical protein [Clostridium botulinum]NFH59621.1 hypothetical protein [Clostridium botulinum]
MSQNKNNLNFYIYGFKIKAILRHPLVIYKRHEIFSCFDVLILNKKEILIHSYIYLISSNGGDLT